MTKKTAFSYLRVSGKGQVKGDGFARQRAAVQAYARAHRLRVLEEYQDKVTGTKELADRAGLAALLDRAEHNGASIVLVERADRLARDVLVGEVILGQFRDQGIKVIECDGGTDLTADTDNPTATLIRQVLGAVSQFEKTVIVLKLKASRDRLSRKAGKRIEGAKPYGFYDDERDTRARMESLYKERSGRRRRRGYQWIANVLNAEGRPTRRGGAWCRQSVHSILAA